MAYTPFFMANGSGFKMPGPSSPTSPAPRPGQGAFGAVPGAIGLPNPYNDLSAAYPNLTGTNSAISSAILSKLRGELSPDTISGIQDDAARFGVANGMPGANGMSGSLIWNKSLRDLGLAKEGQIQSGINAYNATVPTVSGTQTVRPETQVGVAETNSINAAAPDPTAANKYAQDLFDKYLAKLSSPAAATGANASAGGAAKPWWMNGTNTAGSVTRTMPGATSPWQTTYF